MSLVSFSVERYRAFRDRQTVTLAPITLVIGRNNTGKSALLRAPHFLSLPMSTRASEVPFPLEEDGFGRHAWTLREVAWGDDLRGFAGALTWADRTLALEATSIQEERHRQELLRFEVDGVALEQRPWSALRRAMVERGLPVGEDLCWNLTGIRAAPQHRYPFRGADVAGPGICGELAPYQLLQAKHDLGALNTWAARILGCTFDVDDDRNDFAIRVRSRGGPAVNLANCGDGIAQSLPVLTLLLLSEPGSRPSLLCIEQPDLHLHPNAHTELADLLIDAVRRDRGLRLLIECHSDALLLRLRRRIAERVEGLEPADISVLHVEQTDGESRVLPIHLNRRGVPDWWPKGVFSESAAEYVGMRRALSDAG